MSMLAERRQKQKHSLNPRGKWWADDSNKIGQKMMEKMGWTKGKGLGANEQGITECTKVSCQDSTAGIGYDKNLETWTEHKEKFNNFLQQFQSNQSRDIVKKLGNGDNRLSSELQSKQVHAHVQYQKFIRGKDTNKYKSKDLANIFGQKELISENTIQINKNDNIYEREAIGSRDNRYGVVTINSGSMADYFKLKLNNGGKTHSKNKSNSNRSLSNDVTNNQTIVSETENKECIGFGYLSKVENKLLHYGLSKDSGERDYSNYAFDNPCLGMNSPTEATSNADSPKISTKKRKEFTFDNPCLEMNSPTEATSNANDSLKKLAKKRKEFIYDNPCLEMNTPIEAMSNADSPKISTKKRKEFTFDNPCLEMNSPTEATSNANDSLKKSAKKRKEFTYDNPCLEMNTPIEAMSDANDSPKISTKKRKECDALHITEIDKCNTQKKLKTDMINSTKDGFINPALNLDIRSEEDCNGKEFEVSRVQFGLENCGLDLMDERSDKKRVTFNDHIMLYKYDKDSIKKKKGKATLDKFEVENKKQKKKRKFDSVMTSVPNGIVNEALDVEILYDEINDNKLNEHKIKKIKKRKICKTTILETIQESPERENEIIEINTDLEDNLDVCIIENGETDALDKKLKKKKKKTDVIDDKLDVEIEIIDDKNKRDEKSKGDLVSLVTLKKYKKEKKKDKKKSESKKYIDNIDINNDKQDAGILNKSNSKHRQNNLNKDENKDAAEIKTLPVFGVEENEQEKTQKKIKQKKKKRNSINKEDCSKNEIDCDIEKEVSDKENTEKVQNLDTKKSVKKSKKHKKSKNKDTSDAKDSSNHNIEAVDTSAIEPEQIEDAEITNAEFTNTSFNENNVDDAVDNIIYSPWIERQRMTKKMLMSFFHNNAILEFPGSNIHKIKGYGVDIEY